jgi:hypothetical protein
MEAKDGITQGHIMKESAIERQKRNQDNVIHFTAPMLKVQWVVVIPKGGQFQIHYNKDLSWWARMWMRFIGWGVSKG